MIDLNKPVENSAFKAALANHYQVQTKESAGPLFEELMKATFLLGVITDHPLNPAATGGQMIFNKGDRVAIFEVRDESDSKLLALFSDHRELSNFSDQANATFVMPTPQALDFALEKGYQGVVVNPNSPMPLRLDSAFIRSLKIQG